MNVDSLLARAAGVAALDRPATAARRAAERSGLSRLAATAEERLGHPAHPALSDLPIGFWTSAWVLDMVGGEQSARAARTLVGAGLLSALPTAAAGLGDLRTLDERHRRVAVVHASANSVAFALYAASWWQRRKGRPWSGVLLGCVGAAAATLGGALGGALVFGDLGPGDDSRHDASAPADARLTAATAGATNSPTADPSDNTTLSVVLAGYVNNGFDGDFSVREDSTIDCLTCDTNNPADRFTLLSLRRLEGASDPDDMVAVVATTCPSCGARGVIVLGYGPMAAPEHSDAISAMHTGREHRSLPADASPADLVDDAGTVDQPATE